MADDDKVLRSGICKIIEEELPDCKVVYEASNGLKALEYIGKHPVDLLLTDIKMPVMDGLELIREISARNYTVNTVVLSGYSEYAFLREAMKYGVWDYLLKPIGKQELLTLVTRIRDQKISKEMLQNISDRMKEEKQQSRYLFHDSLIYSLVKNSELYNSLVRENDLEIGNITGYLIGLVYPDKVFPENELQSVLNTLQKTTSELFSLSSFPDDQKLVVLFLFRDVSAEDAKWRMPKFAEKLSEAASEICGCGVKISCGCVVSNVKELHVSYQEACRVEEQMFYQTDQCCFLREASIPEGDFHALQDIRNILDMVGNNGTVAAKIALRRLFENYSRYAVSPKEVRKHSLLLYSQLCVHFEQQIEAVRDMNIILRSVSAQEIYDFLEREIDRASFASSTEEARMNNKSAIQKAQEYIRENYDQDISLQDVAQHVFLNATYFSELFKKETGEKFVDFLIRTRIDEAKRILIEEPHVLVNEVGRRVGYNEPVSFNRAFKKQTGSTPVGYRVKYRRQ